MKEYTLITGATSGIGREFAYSLAGRKHNLILTGRRMNILNEIKEELEEENKIEVRVLKVDFLTEIESLIEEIRDLKINFLINNVGYGSGKPFLEDELENKLDMIRVHVDAFTKLTYFVAKKMREEKEGTIINISSLASMTPTKFNHIYSATKSYVNSFTRSLALDLARDSIKVRLILPGFTRTDFHRYMNEDKKRGLEKYNWIRPEDVVKESLNSLSKKKITVVPGRMNKIYYLVLKIIPESLYNYLAKGKEMN